MTLLETLLDPSDFSPRWGCGTWTPLHGWTHVVADLLVFGAYIAIPIVIVRFVLQRRDVPFSRVFWIFGAFILFCGTTHLVEATLFWRPHYRLSALLKVGTAIISWTAVVATIRILPHAVRLPGLARVNTELVRVNGQLDQFAYIVSHDLKAPLRGIASLATWLAEDEKGLSAEGRERLALLDERVRRMDRLIDGILTYARVGRFDENRTTVELGAVVDEVIRSLKVPEGIEVKVHGPLPSVRYVEVHLQQVVQNLLTNALRHLGRPRGLVEISAIDKHDTVEVSVKDDGVGVAKEDHERIFLLFQSQGDGTRASSTGIGLAIVKQIVEKHGGRVGIDSRPGAGSRFWFTIPRGPEAVLPAAAVSL